MVVAAKQASVMIAQQLDKLELWKKDIQATIGVTDTIIQHEHEVIHCFYIYISHLEVIGKSQSYSFSE